MINFNESALELSIMELLQDEDYIHLTGEQIHRERTEVLLIDDLRDFLMSKYVKEDITKREVESIILSLRNISGTIMRRTELHSK